jgi:hypothetical protein
VQLYFRASSFFKFKVRTCVQSEWRSLLERFVQKGDHNADPEKNGRNDGWSVITVISLAAPLASATQVALNADLFHVSSYYEPRLYFLQGNIEHQNACCANRNNRLPTYGTGVTVSIGFWSCSNIRSIERFRAIVACVTYQTVDWLIQHYSQRRDDHRSLSLSRELCSPNRIRQVKVMRWKVNICMIPCRQRLLYETIVRSADTTCAENLKTRARRTPMLFIDKERSDYSPSLLTTIRQFLMLHDIDK